MIGRLVVIALALVAGIFVATVDAAPEWQLCLAGCLLWAVLIVVVLRGRRVHE